MSFPVAQEHKILLHVFTGRWHYHSKVINPYSSLRFPKSFTRMLTLIKTQHRSLLHHAVDHILLPGILILLIKRFGGAVGVLGGFNQLFSLYRAFAVMLFASKFHKQFLDLSKLHELQDLSSSQWLIWIIQVIFSFLISMSNTTSMDTLVWKKVTEYARTPSAKEPSSTQTAYKTSRDNNQVSFALLSFSILCAPSTSRVGLACRQSFLLLIG